jgi:hypothetical protein
MRRTYAGLACLLARGDTVEPRLIKARLDLPLARTEVPVQPCAFAGE